MVRAGMECTEPPASGAVLTHMILQAAASQSACLIVASFSTLEPLQSPLLGNKGEGGCLKEGCVLQAEDGGLGVSLFERLQTAGLQPQLLDLQYRMHPAIADFPSRSFYGGRVQSFPSPEDRPAPVGACSTAALQLWKLDFCRQAACRGFSNIRFPPICPTPCSGSALLTFDSICLIRKGAEALLIHHK